MEQIEWRPVPGIPGYEVSSHGGVRSYLTHADNMVAQRERKPKCRKGHSFDDAYWDPRGRRQCRSCRQDADRRRQPRGTQTRTGETE